MNFTFPENVAGLQRGQSIDNEAHNPGLGVSIPYSAPGVKATLYIYDLGVTAVPEGPMSPLVRKHFAQIIEEAEAAVASGIYASVALKDKFGTGTPERGREFLCAELEIKEHGATLKSFVYLTGHKGKFVKIRVTIPADNTTGIARTFADSFANTLWPNGSGIH